MKRVKRFVALFVVIATLASLCAFSTAVSAQETLMDVEVTESDLLLIEKLEALGLITNEYDAASYVTRRDMAKIIAKYAAIPVSGTTTAKSPFNDVPETDSAYSAIYALYSMGVITGDDQSNYYPDNYVSYDEALVYVVNAVGHKPFVAREGGYPTGYHRIAIRHGMLKNLSAKPGTAAMSLIDVYRLLEAAMTAASVEYVYHGDGEVGYILSDTDTFLSETYNIRKYRDKLTGNQFTYLTSPDSSMTDEQIAIGSSHKKYDTPGYVYGDLLGYTVDYYVRDLGDGLSEMAYIEETPGRNSKIRLDAEDLVPAKTTDTRIFYEDENEKEKNINLSGYLDVIYNNKCYTNYPELEDALPATGYIEALDNDDDGTYDVLFVYDYKSVAVDVVDKYNEKVVTDAADPSNVEEIDLDSSKHTVIMTNAADGKRANINQLKNGDVLSILESKGAEKAITVYLSRNVVSGKISGYDAQLGYLIGEEYYEKVDDYVGTPLAMGLSGDFYLDINNKIVKYEYAEIGDAAKLAVMAAVRYESSTFLTEIEVRIFNEDGDFVEAPLKEVVRIDGAKYDLKESAEADAALALITKDAMSPYELTSAYLLKYTLSSDGKISAIERAGGIGGEGRLNVLAEDGNNLCFRSGYIFRLDRDSNPGLYGTFNKAEGIVFTTPEDGNLGNLDEYSIFTGVAVDHPYENNPTTAYTNVANVAAYSYNRTGVTKADVFIFRGMGGAAGKKTKFSVVEEVTRSLDSNDEERVTLYMGNGDKHLLATDVVVKKNGSVVSFSELGSGDAIQGITDARGFVREINIYAEWDAIGEEVVPTIGIDANGLPKYLESTVFGYGGSNSTIATVSAIDTEMKRLQYKTKLGVDATTYEDISRPLVIDNSEIVVYYTETGRTAMISLEEIMPGDVFAAILGNYSYGASQMVIFR